MSDDTETGVSDVEEEDDALEEADDPLEEEDGPLEEEDNETEKDDTNDNISTSKDTGPDEKQLDTSSVDPDTDTESDGDTAPVLEDESDNRKHSEEIIPQAVKTRLVVIVDNDKRITSHIMTRAEVTRAIAIRAQQITNNPHAFTPVEGLSDAVSIARKELYDHRSPLILRREIGRTPKGERIIEKWNVREMSYPPLN